MDRADLTALRKALNLTQAEMAEKLGLSTRGYQDIEYGRANLRPVHAHAAERIALSEAIRQNNPMLAPVAIRREALDLARMIAGA